MKIIACTSFQRSIYYDGKFENQVDVERVKEFMDVVRRVRA